MKAICKTLPLAAFLLARINAQDTTDDSNYGGSSDDVTTSYYTLCPDETTSSSAPTSGVTVDPNQLTRTGDDGRTTIYRTETTILPHMCPSGDGVCGATYVLSEDCPCTAGAKTTWDACPDGFTTTAAECTVCASNGGPATVTLTVPMDNGPYASVTPKYGSPVNNPTDICTENTSQATGVSGTTAGSDNTPAMPTGSNNNAGDSSTGSGDRYGVPAVNTTKPYLPYTGAAAKLNIGREAGFTILGAGLVGALAVFL